MSTLVDLIRMRAADEPDRTAYIFLTDGESEDQRFSYRELEASALRIAGLLQERGVKQGDRVLLLYPPSLDYVAAFFGCLFAGAVAVPAYPPRPKGPMTRLDAIARDARASVALTTESILAGVRQQLDGGFDARVESWLATDGLDGALANTWRMPSLLPDTLAFLQYTSGSTSTPKGVMVSHGNLMANERMLETALEQDRESTWVGWLPIFHDMGLIGNVIQPLYVGAPSILMAPMSFIQEPIRWLRAITKYKARTSGAPNFAYDLCAAKIPPAEREGLDLSSWTVAFNGSEPVRQDTLDRFVAAFEPFGFRRTSFYPCYGLAEATLLVSGPLKSDEPLVQSFQTADLEQRRAVTTPHGKDDGRFLVGCGRTWLDQTIAIVDPDTSRRCSGGQIGEIWVAGPNVAQGYWNREDSTAATFGAHVADGGEGPFLRTGDLGFFHDGEVFISGRIKDLIIIRGRNHFPQDIERTVESSHPVLRPGCGAAFSIDVNGDERLVVVQEVARTFREADLAAVVGTIRQEVTKNHELAAHAVALIKPGHIPKTSSGKIQRQACRQLFLTEALDPLLVSVLSDTMTKEGPASPASGPSLLRQTLAMLGPETSRAVLESHIRERAGEIASPGSAVLAGGTLGELDASARSRLRRQLEVDLGVPVPETLVLAAPTLDALASGLIGLVIDPASGSRPT